MSDIYLKTPKYRIISRIIIETDNTYFTLSPSLRDWELW